MKKFKLEDLKHQSFVTTLTDVEKGQIKGGILIASVTCKANPKTDEPKVSTCTTSPSDTTGGNSCSKAK